MHQKPFGHCCAIVSGNLLSSYRNNRSNPLQGAIKLAEVWNELPVPELIAIVESWKPSEIAPVLNEMDSEKAAEVMAKMKPKQASDVSRELKRIASIVPVTAE